MYAWTLLYYNCGKFLRPLSQCYIATKQISVTKHLRTFYVKAQKNHWHSDFISIFFLHLSRRTKRPAPLLLMFIALTFKVRTRYRYTNRSGTSNKNIWLTIGGDFYMSQHIFILESRVRSLPKKSGHIMAPDQPILLLDMCPP